MAKLTLMTRAKTWGKKQGENAYDGFVIVQDAINQVIESRNWDVLAQILGKESTWSDKERSIVKAILRDCVTGLDMKQATKQQPHQSGLRFEMSESLAWTERGETFKQFLEGAGSDEKNQCRFTSGYLESTILGQESNEDSEKEYTWEQALKRAKSLVKDLESKGVSLDTFINMMQHPERFEQEPVQVAA